MMHIGCIGWDYNYSLEPLSIACEYASGMP